jgi:hypothetical protein
LVILAFKDAKFKALKLSRIVVQKKPESIQLRIVLDDTPPRDLKLWTFNPGRDLLALFIHEPSVVRERYSILF